MSIDKLGGHEPPRVSRTDAVRRTNASGEFRLDGGRSVPGGRDQLVVSSEARTMAAARKAVSDASDVRMEKVAELRQRISSGNYTVDSQALANALKDTGAI